MNLPLLDIPDDPQAWPLWLEGQLVGSDLGELVAELTLALDATSAGPSLSELCSPALPAVLERGLSALTSEQVRLLLKHPQRLLDLQERILCDGGDYWTTKIDGGASAAETARRWQQLQPRLRDSGATVPQPNATGPLTTRRQWGLLIGTLAAGGVIGMGLWLQQPGGEWGWNRPGVLTADLSDAGFLQHLADAADEYFDRPRNSRSNLERQLVAFRRGCDALQAARLSQLTAADRDWLKERCRVWSQKFDGQLAELRSGGRPWQAVREDADETVRALETALRERLA